MTKSDVSTNSEHTTKTDGSLHSKGHTGKNFDMLRENIKEAKQRKVDTKWSKEQKDRIGENAPHDEIDYTDLFKVVRGQLKKGEESTSEVKEKQPESGESTRSTNEIDYQALQERFKEIQRVPDQNTREVSELRKGITELEGLRGDPIRLLQNQMESKIGELWQKPRDKTLQRFQDAKIKNENRNLNKKYAEVSRDIKITLNDIRKLHVNGQGMESDIARDTAYEQKMLKEYHSLMKGQAQDSFEFNNKGSIPHEKISEDLNALQKRHISELEGYMDKLDDYIVEHE